MYLFRRFLLFVSVKQPLRILKNIELFRYFWKNDPLYQNILISSFIEYSFDNLMMFQTCSSFQNTRESVNILCPNIFYFIETHFYLFD